MTNEIDVDAEVHKLHLRRQIDERHTAAREKVRAALAEYAADLGGAIIIAETGRLDESDRRQFATSLVQVESAKRVLWMDR